MASIDRPSEAVMFYENSAVCNSAECFPRSSADMWAVEIYLASLHSKGTIFAYADGHAKWIQDSKKRVGSVYVY